ncbi:xanthine dehydrogenase family protein molybdopterin-binding subunit [Dankookia rubra]|uniref:Xanthine dehydrogenase family protein molybdopterin-binding subunit n=1 Tax=Dankookia rubra TaxID=1442381 RepID=A0A4R5QI85_9PROT|nr:molybdopterin cofactor-binding domain-containing protein [Dankookia rubra]TDH63090.1 xanthine dehydrogenase family protein molybdopterin-binding subunit [Dankookia rubra]
MNAIAPLSRRGFFSVSAAAGAFTLGIRAPLAQTASLPGATFGGVPEINAWVVVKPDDSVVIRIARSEMGQGTLTGLAQLVAEELDCDWAKVTTEYPTPGQNLARNRVWGDFSTGGSRGIRESNEYVRKGGAAARMMLVQAAADAWGVAAAECRAAKSVVTHTASGRTATYGSLAVAAAKLTPPATIALKDPKDWTIAGKPLPRLDTVDKTTGKQVYGADLKLPGMLNASIRDCPVFGGKLKGFDEAAAMARPGVRKVVRVGESAVAVVAETWWQANTALDALKIEWDAGSNQAVSQATIDATLKEGLGAAEAFVGNKAGDARAALPKAAKTVEATYTFPFQNHATMEPMNATAVWNADRCEVWCPTQNGEASLAAAAEAAGLRPAQCEVHKTLLGGGFGRRGWQDFVRQAVAIAKEMPGTPVKLLWSREEDMLHGRYHPITACKLTAGLDPQGNLDSLHMRISGQSIIAGIAPQMLQGGADSRVFQGLNPGGAEGAFGYAVPNLLIDHAMRNPHVPPGFWRGVNVNQNAVYMECFIDEVAQAAGKDPLDFRRALLKGSPKHLAVLNAVAEKGGWGKPAPAGRHRGLAQIMGYGSYVAACAEVTVSPAGEVTIHKITAATDCGHAVNPQQIAAQIEGSFAYGLTAMLYGECTVKDGAMEQANFDTYPIMRLAEMPAVESIVMPSGGFWGGVGEPTIAVAAPAVLNAIFAATGKRVRQLPLKHADLRRA